jgi:hypothetical protein
MAHLLDLLEGRLDRIVERPVSRAPAKALLAPSEVADVLDDHAASF